MVKDIELKRKFLNGYDAALYYEEVINQYIFNVLRIKEDTELNDNSIKAYYVLRGLDKEFEQLIVITGFCSSVFIKYKDILTDKTYISNMLSIRKSLIRNRAYVNLLKSVIGKHSIPDNYYRALSYELKKNKERLKYVYNLIKISYFKKEPLNIWVESIVKRGENPGKYILDNKYKASSNQSLEDRVKECSKPDEIRKALDIVTEIEVNDTEANKWKLLNEAIEIIENDKRYPSLIEKAKENDKLRIESRDKAIEDKKRRKLELEEYKEQVRMCKELEEQEKVNRILKDGLMQNTKNLMLKGIRKYEFFIDSGRVYTVLIINNRYEIKGLLSYNYNNPRFTSIEREFSAFGESQLNSMISYLKCSNYVKYYEIIDLRQLLLLNEKYNGISPRNKVKMYIEDLGIGYKEFIRINNKNKLDGANRFAINRFSAADNTATISVDSYGNGAIDTTVIDVISNVINGSIYISTTSKLCYIENFFKQ